MSSLDLGKIDFTNVDLGDLDLGSVDLGNVDLGSVNLGSLGSEDNTEVSPWEAGWDTFTGGAAKSTAKFLNTLEGTGVAGALLKTPVGMVYDKLFSDEKGNVFTKTADHLDQYANEAFENSKKYRPKVASYKDINTLGQLGDYVGESLAAGSTEIGSFLLRRLTTPLQIASYVGQTAAEQEEKGEANWARAGVTGAMEALLNVPISRAANRVIEGISKAPVSEEVKRSAIKDFALGTLTDASVGGAQQMLRNYGVEGYVSMKDVDEAVVGGLIVGTPLRGAEAFTNRHVANQLTEVAADEAVRTGDFKKADGFVQEALNFTVGGALRKNRRMQDTQAGGEMFTRIQEMQHSRDMFANEVAVRIDEITHGIKDKDKFFDDYARGRNDTPQLMQLRQLMDGIEARANDENGANLKIGHIENYLPTTIDLKDFDKGRRDSLLADYTNWYNSQPDSVRLGENALVTPEKAKGLIESFNAQARSEQSGVARNLPRVKMDDDGNITKVTPVVEVKSAIKSGQLEHSRRLGFIPQHILRQYSVNDNMPEQIKAYGFSAAQRITYAEQLGKNNERLNELVFRSNQELPEKLTRGEVDNIYNALDAYQGVYRQFERESQRKMATYFRTVGNVVALPLTLFSSFTEPFNLAIKVGNVNAGKAFIGALSSISQDLISTVTRGLVPKSEVNKQLLLAGRSFQNATTALNNRIDGNQMGKVAQGINNAFFHVTGQTSINYLVNSMGAHAAKSQVKNDVQIIAGAPNTRAYQAAKQRLADLGVSVEQAQMLHNDGAMLNALMPDIVARFNRDVALDPTALDKPVWMSTGWGAMFAQLRGYPTMFTNTVLPKFMAMVDPRGKTGTEIAVSTAQFMSTVGGILAIGFLQEAIKNEVRGGNETEEEIFVKAMQNTLMPIHMSYLLDVATGNLGRTVVPASFSIMDRNTGLLNKALEGNVELYDLPILSSFKGVLE